VDGDEVVAGLLQPHEGSSETTASRMDFERLSGFNPTRVRLKPSGAVVTVEQPSELQPHEGSSETLPLN